MKSKRLWQLRMRTASTSGKAGLEGVEECRIQPSVCEGDTGLLEAHLQQSRGSHMGSHVPAVLSLLYTAACRKTSFSCSLSFTLRLMHTHALLAHGSMCHDCKFMFHKQEKEQPHHEAKDALLLDHRATRESEAKGWYCEHRQTGSWLYSNKHGLCRTELV